MYHNLLNVQFIYTSEYALEKSVFVYVEQVFSNLYLQTQNTFQKEEKMSKCIFSLDGAFKVEEEENMR